ncbi:ureidoglycolate lyase [Veronia nyctiphanis]|uniref:Ureidoglycolate lyase n=1 Tax=Veronia nyctiphanis TaxID=1278244 RepID=A0A4Q0YPD8_9GAMM|nr:ureidoglycolate lyase [Veronia nyctiphanis]RXJ72403.1 ureidoglycolate lyase [Veronia nyctiphanis]
MSEQKHALNIQPLTKEAFAPFGDVIEIEGRDYFEINSGFARRYHKLATTDVDEKGEVIISIFTANPYDYPLEVQLMERHPKGSQAFMPLQKTPFLVVVAPAGEEPSISNICAFRTNGKQGINYRQGVWHHPALVLNDNEQFLVVDRSGEGENCDEFEFQNKEPMILSPQF